ncbi:MAG: MipA/OmpV family protein [Pseudomonadota bacterium]
MRQRSFYYGLLGAAVFVPGFIAPVNAQSDAKPKYDDFIAVGAVSVPEFEGSDSQQTVPLLFGQVSFSGNRYLSIQGTGLRVNVLNSSKWSAGPSANFQFGRDDGVESARIAALQEVDIAIELGGFVSRSWVGVGHPTGVLTAGLNFVHDVAGAHDGWQAQASMGYGRNFGNRFRLTGNAGATFVNDDYAETYFTVSDTDSARSGLDTFQAEGGLKDVGVSLVGTYKLADRWSAVGFTSYRRLVGDAADTPIVDREGDANQLIVAIGVGYSF